MGAGGNFCLLNQDLSAVPDIYSLGGIEYAAATEVVVCAVGLAGGFHSIYASRLGVEVEREVGRVAAADYKVCLVGAEGGAGVFVEAYACIFLAEYVNSAADAACSLRLAGSHEFVAASVTVVAALRNDGYGILGGNDKHSGVGRHCAV